MDKLIYASCLLTKNLQISVLQYGGHLGQSHGSPLRSPITHKTSLILQRTSQGISVTKNRAVQNIVIMRQLGKKTLEGLQPLPPLVALGIFSVVANFSHWNKETERQCYVFPCLRLRFVSVHNKSSATTGNEDAILSETPLLTKFIIARLSKLHNKPTVKRLSL